MMRWHKADPGTLSCHGEGCIYLNQRSAPKRLSGDHSGKLGLNGFSGAILAQQSRAPWKMQKPFKKASAPNDSPQMTVSRTCLKPSARRKIRWNPDTGVRPLFFENFFKPFANLSNLGNLNVIWKLTKSSQTFASSLNNQKGYFR